MADRTASRPAKAAGKSTAKRAAAKAAKPRKAAAKKATAKRATGKAAESRKTTAKKAAAKKAPVNKAPAKKAPAKKAVTKQTPAKVVLLSGGNPQIPKGYGDAPVQAYIAAMPGWKRDLGRRLDALIERAVPHVYKAVKWNSPFYGIEGEGWFLNLHCFTRYVKVAFFRGSSLRPAPPGKSKYEAVRYLDIREDDELDEVQFVDWVKQASRLPGERM